GSADARPELLRWDDSVGGPRLRPDGAGLGTVDPHRDRPPAVVLDPQRPAHASGPAGGDHRPGLRQLLPARPAVARPPRARQRHLWRKSGRYRRGDCAGPRAGGLSVAGVHLLLRGDRRHLGCISDPDDGRYTALVVGIYGVICLATATSD